LTAKHICSTKENRENLTESRSWLQPKKRGVVFQFGSPSVFLKGYAEPLFVNFGNEERRGKKEAGKILITIQRG